MDRVGCINLSHLPLQILLRAHPEWDGFPVAVTKEEKPTSHLVSVNHAAEEQGARVGIRYSEALSLIPALRAGCVSQDQIHATLDDVVRILTKFTPDIELCSFDTDAIWVNVSGMQSLFVSLRRWLVLARDALRAEGFRARIIVGYTRFGSYAISRSSSKSMILNSLAEEQEMLGRSPLSVFPLSIRTNTLLARLGIKTVRDFQALPLDGTIKRFGSETKALFEILRADTQLPLQSIAILEPMLYAKRFDSPLFTQALVMEHVVELIGKAIAQANNNSMLVEELELSLRTEDGDYRIETIRPAKATGNERILIRLVDLRLANTSYKAGIEEVILHTVEVPPSNEQHDLFGSIDMSVNAGAQAFALIRARLGNDAISIARLSDSHVPEKAFVWESIEKPPLSRAVAHADAQKPSMIVEECRAIRRIFLNPPEVKSNPYKKSLIAGPFVIEGEWWKIDETRPDSLSREYYFHTSTGGEIVWACTDHISGKSHVLGLVD